LKVAASALGVLAVGTIGTRTGQASRDSLLRKSIRTAGWGACPPRSAISIKARDCAARQRPLATRSAVGRSPERQCKEPSARSFKPVLVGASPTTGAISPPRSRSPTGRGTASRAPRVLVQIAAPAAMQLALRVCRWALSRHAFSRDYHFGTRSFESEASAF